MDKYTEGMIGEFSEEITEGIKLGIKIYLFERKK